jgi:tRNA-2-methylthio-N6-dimethylallyladenosine synthase
MNKAESDSLVYELDTAGWSSALSPQESDVIILNTCSVRITAEERIWGRIGFFRHEKKKNPFKLVIIGCMAERLREGIIERAPEVDVVIGNFSKHRIAELLANPEPVSAQKVVADENDYHFSSAHGSQGFRAFVPIMHGCDNFCSYCIVPHVRGREISREPSGILSEIRALSEEKVREITLLGQNVNSYKYENGKGPVRFKDLLESVSKAFGDAGWIRFLTSHPKDFSMQLIDVIAASDNICHHVHLPIQHASDRILETMNRKYTIAYYRKLIESVRHAIPDISITTDIMIGFPGETEDDFRFTIDSMEELAFEDAFTYKYNPREGTAAFSMGDSVPEDRKLERLDAVIRLQRRVSREKKKLKLDKVVNVLVEDVSKKSESELLARTEQDEMVVFPGNRSSIGSFTRVRLCGLSGNTFTGKEMLQCPGN